MQVGPKAALWQGRGSVCSPGLALPGMAMSAEEGDANCLSSAKAGDHWVWGSKLGRGPLYSVSSGLRYTARQRCHAGDAMSE